jgi:hypothetical protein
MLLRDFIIHLNIFTLLQCAIIIMYVHFKFFLNTSILMEVNFCVFLSFSRLCSYLYFVGCFFCADFIIGVYTVEQACK